MGVGSDPTWSNHLLLEACAERDYADKSALSIPIYPDPPIDQIERWNPRHDGRVGDGDRDEVV
jgi:hypothetical protein